MKKCPNCQTIVLGNFCPSCGKKAVEWQKEIRLNKYSLRELKCPNCGATLWEYGKTFHNIRFCEQCGYNLANNLIKQVFNDRNSMSYIQANNALFEISSCYKKNYIIPVEIECICNGAFKNVDVPQWPDYKIFIHHLVKCIQINALVCKENDYGNDLLPIQYLGTKEEFFEICEIKRKKGNSIDDWYFETPFGTLTSNCWKSSYLHKIRIDCSDGYIHNIEFWKEINKRT